MAHLVMGTSKLVENSNKFTLDPKTSGLFDGSGPKLLVLATAKTTPSSGYYGFCLEIEAFIKGKLDGRNKKIIAKFQVNFSTF